MMSSTSDVAVALPAPVTATVPSLSSSSLIRTHHHIKDDTTAKHATVQLLRTVIHMLLMQQQQYSGSTRSRYDGFESDDKICIDIYTKPFEQLGVLNYLLQRCRQMDALMATPSTTGSTTRTGTGTNDHLVEHSDLERTVLLKGMLHCYDDSGYTVLHDAIYQSDISRIFFLLRLDQENHRFTKRPMEILYNYTNSASGCSSSSTNIGSHKNTALQDMISQADHEGMTPIMLLTRLQRNELHQCRQHLQQIFQRQQELQASSQFPSQKRRTSRSNSWYDDLRNSTPELNDTVGMDEQNEFDVLSRAMSQYQQSSVTRRSNQNIPFATTYHGSNNHNYSLQNHTATTSYGYEVVTFGRAHHCALGVAVSNRNASHHHYPEERTMSVSTDHHTTSTCNIVKHASASHFRPQRVMAFAQDTVGRSHTAIAVACSTYHTLTITASGQLYANGLGKGGRLGTGNEKPCATPTLITGPLLKQFVIAIAAAENHSLCITQQGYVYAYGSNGFGQLGISNNTTRSVIGTDHNNNNNIMNARCVPRRVDDLKHVTCVKVAAGLKHSVALSKDGEIYVWGDNSSGQLGIQGYGTVGGSSGSSNSSHIHKVTRIDTLWNAKPHPKVAIDIAASDQSTITLISGSGQKGFAVNTIYCWGNGNHLPSKVHFEISSTHIINPIAISCAKYHNVALTSNGHVYSWGLHADPLGTQNNSGVHPRRNRSSSIENDKVKNKHSFTTNATTTSLSAPQLVTGMLLENGGGKVVSISASENHTAVLTEDGHLWTWGDTYKQNVLGHEGIRWQPEPKRVPGVHRAVAVAAAKEHTVLLIGTSFPPIQTVDRSSSSFPTLESLAARSIAKHCDLFNVVPIMTMAERTQTKELLQYCKKFIRLNLDGVLNVGQKSVMDSYLNEQLLGSSLERTKERYRDETMHPLISEVILAGSDEHESFIKDRLCNVDRWIRACADLSRQPLVQAQVKRIWHKMNDETLSKTKQEYSNVLAESNKPTDNKIRSSSFSIERYEELTTNMDIATIDLAEAKLLCLTKEARAVRKRLAHISKLESSHDNLICLTNEQKQKVARRYQLEMSLKKLDPAVQIVEERLRSFRLLENHERMMKDEPDTEDVGVSNENCVDDNEDTSKYEGKSTEKGSLRCEICAITCPDSKSFQLHMSGRKHRNRMEQVDNDQTKLAAASIVEEHHKQLLLQSLDAPTEPKHEKNCAWGQTAKAAVKPKYTLPPPPHPVTDTLMTQSGNSRVTLSLQDIMADEEKKAKQKLGTKKGIPFLQLPVGCPTTFPSPPWETASKLQSMQSPTTKSPAVRSSPKVKSVTSPATTTPKTSFLLADFIPPQKPTHQHVPKVKPGVAWTTPKKDSISSISLKEIQVQEQDFKLKQDQTFGSPNSNNKWFIEQRERAGSFKEIQGETAKEVEQRLLIEEQKSIEKQIYDDIAAASAAAVNVKKSKKKNPDYRKSSQQKRCNRKPSQNSATGK